MAGSLVVAGWVVAVPAASAAGALVASTPGPKQELDAPPAGVSLAFDRVVKRDVVKVLVLNSAGANVVVGDLVYSGSSVTVQLNNNLPKGTYTVKYQINRKDGQPEGGAYQFAYGKGKWTNIVTSWSGTAEQPPEMANPDPLATGPVETPSTTAPVVEVGDATASPTPAATAPTAGAPTTAEASPAPTPGPSGDGSGIVWALAGIVVLAAAGVGGWLLFRRSRG